MVIVLGDESLELLEFAVFIEELIVQELVLLLGTNQFLFLFEDSVLELLVQFVVGVRPILLYFYPFEFLLEFLEFETLEFVLFEEHLIEFLVLLVLVFELYYFHLVVFLLVLDLEVEILVMLLCNFESSLDGLDLPVEFVDVHHVYLVVEVVAR